MTYSLEFTERMTGAFGFAETGYRAGFEAGQQSGNRLLFVLTIGTDDVDAMIADPRHGAAARGYVRCDALGGRLPVQEGSFDLFVRDGGAAAQDGAATAQEGTATGQEGIATGQSGAATAQEGGAAAQNGAAARRMLYRLYFADGTGRPLTLAGFKDVRPGPVTAVWPETSTLFTRILNGHVPVTDGGSAATDGVVGSGILRIRPMDFAWQLTTFRVRGPTWGGRARALDAFGRLFLTELWEVFDPLRRSRPRAASSR